MKDVICKVDGEVIGQSDGKAFYKDGKATKVLTCHRCGHSRKFR
jgi:hypothetical protein